MYSKRRIAKKLLIESKINKDEVNKICGDDECNE